MRAIILMFGLLTGCAAIGPAAGVVGIAEAAHHWNDKQDIARECAKVCREACR